jgi:hypothetical protein
MPPKTVRRERDPNQPTLADFMNRNKPKNVIPCKFYSGVQGSCKDGDRCPYLHGVIEASKSSTGGASHSYKSGGAASSSSSNNNNNNHNRKNEDDADYDFDHLLDTKPTRQNNTAQQRQTFAAVPWDENYTYLCPITRKPRPIWKAVESQLGEPIERIQDFFRLLSSLVSIGHRQVRDPTSWKTLAKALRSMPGANWAENVFMKQILSKIIEYVLLAPRAFKGGIPLLVQNAPSSQNRKVMTQLQVSILLSVAFFGLFPTPGGSRQGVARNKNVPGMNLTSLFSMSGNNVVGKIQCILAYFETITTPSVAQAREQGDPCYFLIEFIRSSLPNTNEVKTRMASSKNAMAPIDVDDIGVIETQDGKLQADFANRTIGGGCLHHGCVQEEIRFMISPELLVSRLFVEDLLDNEAIVISGTLRYSEYIGYGGGFCFERRIFPLPEATEKEVKAKMYNISVVAFDAIDFSFGPGMSPELQYRSDWVWRELIKAYIAFVPVSESRAPSANLIASPVATGNWGCGVFAGDLELKFVIQLIAASFIGRPMSYYTFANSQFAARIDSICDLFEEKKVTVSQLLTMVQEFSDLHEKAQDEKQRIAEEGDEDVQNQLLALDVEDDDASSGTITISDNDDDDNEDNKKSDASSETVDYELVDNIDDDVQEVRPKSAPSSKKQQKAPVGNKKNIAEKLKKAQEKSKAAKTKQKMSELEMKRRQQYAILNPPKSVFGFISSLLSNNAKKK